MPSEKPGISRLFALIVQNAFADFLPLTARALFISPVCCPTGGVCIAHPRASRGPKPGKYNCSGAARIAGLPRAVPRSDARLATKTPSQTLERGRQKNRLNPCCQLLANAGNRSSTYRIKAVHTCHRTAFWLWPRKSHNRGVCLISLKNISICQRLLKKPAGKILRDDLIVLTGAASRGKYPQVLRLVRAVVEVDGQEREMEFLTNNLEWAASSIVELYKSR